MSTYTRPTKTVSGDGTTSFVAGNTLPASELNTEMDNLVNHINGSLDEDNLDAGTQIPNSMLVAIDGTKVVDHADDDSTYFTTTSPGDTGSVTAGSSALPTNLEEELERLRYRIGVLNGYGTNVKYFTDGNAEADASWIEPAIVGRNLLKNSSFESANFSSGDAPPGWTATGTIAASALVTAALPYGGHKRQFSWTVTGTNAGFTQTIEGLKASTKYIFGVRYVVSAGTISISTAGGLAAGNDYQDPTFTDATVQTSHVSMIVKTDATPTDITVSIVGTTSAANLSVVDSWFYEIGDIATDPAPHIPMQTATHSTEVTNLPTLFDTSWDSNWTTDSNLNLSQYVPGPGYRLIYEADIQWATVLNSTAFAFGFRLRMNDGSDSTVHGPLFVRGDDHGTGLENRSGIVRLSHVVENATPGVTYAFSYQVTAYQSSATDSKPRLHPLVRASVAGTGEGTGIQSTSRATLRVERI